MTLKTWLDKQGFPHGMECVGEERLQQLWDAAQHEMREECGEIANKKAAEVLEKNTYRGRTSSAASFAAEMLEDVGATIRMRSNR